MGDYRKKLESLSFRASVPRPKVTTDVHDSHSVDVTEHWSERVDVTVKPGTVTLSASTRED